MTHRRALMLAAASAALLPLPAPAQIRRNDLDGLPLPVKQDDTLAGGYRRALLARWGDRVAFDAPPFRPEAPNAEAASGQFGWDAQVMGVATPRQAAADGVPRAVLAVAHPMVNAAMAFPDGRDRPDVVSAMQGASLLNLEKRGRSWVVVDGGFQNRRLHGASLCRMAGPAAARTGDAVIGLLAPQAGSVTPWGTILLAEGDPAPMARRLAPLDARFATPTGFGWVAEIDPFDPQSVPVKRTALGRFAHGDAAATLARDGRAVAYLTDKREGGFLFRFLSAGPATGEGALDNGALHVARLEGEVLRWLPLPATVEVAMNPLLAAAAAGGTAFDTPAGLGLDPRKPRLLLACRGSQARPFGHVIELTPSGDDDGAETMRAALLFAGGAPGSANARYGQAGLPQGSAWIGMPDSVAVDARGRAWIGTSQGGRVGAQPDGIFSCDLEGPGRGVPLPLYGAPRGAGIGGVALAPDGETLFAGVRHPGAEPGASYAKPGTRWPEFEAGRPPRSALLGVERTAGGAVGG